MVRLALRVDRIADLGVECKCVCVWEGGGGVRTQIAPLTKSVLTLVLRLLKSGTATVCLTMPGTFTATLQRYARPH